MNTPSESRATQAFKYARTIVGLLVFVAVARVVVDNQRYLNHSVRLTGSRAGAEIDGIVAALDGEKIEEPRTTKAQATVVIIRGAFRRRAGPITVVDMDRRLAAQGWTPGKRVRADERLYSKGDNVARITEGSTPADYSVSIEWGNANVMCERRQETKGTESEVSPQFRLARKRRAGWIVGKTLHDEVVVIYARRMQIEQSFRDLKPHRHGVGFEDSLTRTRERLAQLLLILALATFVAWMIARTARREVLVAATATLVRSTRAGVLSWHRIGWRLLRE